MLTKLSRESCIRVNETEEAEEDSGATSGMIGGG